MSDGQTLFAILAVLYLSDCFLWVSKQSVVFFAPWRRQWRIAAANLIFGSARGGFQFLNPIPPFGSAFLCHLSPVSISPLGVCAYNLQTFLPSERAIQSRRFRPTADITGSSSDDAYLIVNNERFAKCATAEQAKAISEVINAMTKASPPEREGIARRYIKDQFAAGKVDGLLREMASLAGPIRWACLVLFVFIFVITPILAIEFSLIRVLIPAAILMFILAVQISVMFHNAHRRLCPDAKQERIVNMIKMILCPPLAIRAGDLLSVNLVSQFSPVVLATFFSGPGTHGFIRKVFLDLQYPLRHELSDPKAVEAVTWTAAEQLNQARAFLGGNSGLGQKLVFDSPQQKGDAVSYCPRCNCQFHVNSNECPDCPGVKLLAFARYKDRNTEPKI